MFVGKQWSGKGGAKLSACVWKGKLGEWKNMLWCRDLSQPQHHVWFTQEDVASLQHFVSATYPVKFTKLNSVQHVAGTKLPTNFVLYELKIIRTYRGHVEATCPGDMYRRHVYAMLLCRCCMSQLHSPQQRLLVLIRYRGNFGVGRIRWAKWLQAKIERAVIEWSLCQHLCRFLVHPTFTQPSVRMTATNFLEIIAVTLATCFNFKFFGKSFNCDDRFFLLIGLFSTRDWTLETWRYDYWKLWKLGEN